MPTEIERKFLVTGNEWRQPCPRHLAQGYLNRDKYRTVRVRIDDGCGFLTVKGVTTGGTRSEFEYPIPLAEAGQLLALCDGPVIEKLRHEVVFDGTAGKSTSSLATTRGWSSRKSNWKAKHRHSCSLHGWARRSLTMLATSTRA